LYWLIFVILHEFKKQKIESKNKNLKNHLIFILIVSIFKFRDNNFQFLQFHQPHLRLVLNISKNSVLMKGNKFHYSSFFDKEKILPFCPRIFQSVGKEFTLIIRQELDIFVIKIELNGNLYMWILTVIKEKIVMDIFLVDSLSEKLVNFL